MKSSFRLAGKFLSICLISLMLAPATHAQSQTDSNPPQRTSPNQSQAQSSSPAQGSSAQADQQQNTPTQPVGTAAAPAEKTLGVAASRPAGAVIAPGKQRRARSIVIKVGIVVGACIAIGTVAALSHGSPSQAH